MPEKRNLTELLPVIPLRGTVAFPHMIMHFDVAREMSVKAIEEALHGERRVFLVAQEDVFDETPESSDLFEVGVVAEIRQTIKSQDDAVRVLIEGLYRAKFKKMKYQGGMLVAEVRRLPLNSREDYDSLKMDALMRAVKGTYQEYAELFPKMPREILITVMCQSDPMKFYEEIVFNTMLEYKDKQLLLEEGKISERLKMLNDMLARETMVLSMEKEIHDKTQESIDQGQKEYFLREQLRTITNQLHDEFGEDTGERNESYYVERLEEIEMYLPEESSAKLYKEIARLRQMPPASQEAYVVTSYLDTVFDLPWKNLSDDSVDLKKAEASLDADHYGLQKVKERIIESLAVRVLNPDLKGQILCLVGPPGVGKSSIGKSIASSIGREFARVSLGGVRDEADIRGHRKTYIGAMPGRIIAALQQAGTKNPVILLDELDKMGNDYKGDPSAALDRKSVV